MPSPGRTPNKTASYKRNREIMGKRTSRPVDLPTAEQLATERRRLRYKSKYSRTLRSTVAILVVVAALAVLIATLWMPVLRIYGSSMAKSLSVSKVHALSQAISPRSITGTSFSSSGISQAPGSGLTSTKTETFSLTGRCWTNRILWKRLTAKPTSNCRIRCRTSDIS